MDFDKYGPFGQIVLIAGALAATFSLLMLKMIGRTRQWVWLVSDSPPLIITAGARFLAIAIMAVVYVTINRQNYLIFAGAAIVLGVIGVAYIVRFNRMRMLYVAQIPLIATDGSQLKDAKGRDQFRHVIIGEETEINEEARNHFNEAKRKYPGLTLLQFMSGYGTPPNTPESLWTRHQLAALSNQLTMCLIWIALLGVIILYLSAFVIEIHNTTAPY